MSKSKLWQVFVYGTLKRGEPNHKVLSTAANGYSKYLNDGKTTEKMPLVIATRYNIPFMLNKSGTGHQILGEIYEVDDQMMVKLDELEDYPNYYDRQLKSISTDDGDQTCWVYMLKDFPDQLLAKHHLAEYKNSKEIPYIERSQRDFSAKDDLNY